jgi:hypothetical protein
MKNIASRKSPLKALAFFLSISSLVGISSMPATAEEATWDLTVEIVDTGCNEDITPPSWNPSQNVEWDAGNNQVDLEEIEWNSQLDFNVNLSFQQGLDNCNGGFIDMTGTVAITFTPDPGSPLVMSDSWCGGSTVDCVAEEMFRMGNSDIYGTLDASDATTTGEFSGTLTVVWTP